MNNDNLSYRAYFTAALAVSIEIARIKVETMKFRLGINYIKEKNKEYFKKSFFDANSELLKNEINEAWDFASSLYDNSVKILWGE